MKHIIKLLVLFALVFTFSDCSKGGSGGSGGDTPTPPQEANLSIKLTPEPAGGLNQTLSASYTFSVDVQSTMPAQGVTIKVDYVKDAGGVVFTKTQTATATSTSFTITNIPYNEVGTVTVVVTSVSKPSNTVTRTFKLVRK